MTLLLQAKSLTHHAGQKTLFEDLDLAISTGDRLALVGHNGSGKSTLLNILSGTQPVDAGRLSTRRGLSLAMVEQFLPAELASTTLVDAVTAKTRDAARWQAEELLHKLAFADAEFDIATEALSGGQQNRLMLARALATTPELLLLDEPTNHLDLATLVLFEKLLGAFSGACLIVSHDRVFLDAVTDKTLFLRDERIYRFDLSYSPAKQALLAADVAAVRSRAAEGRKIDALKASAKRLATWGKVYDSEKFARRARSMEKRVGRLEAEQTFVSGGSPLELKLELGETRAKQVVAIRNVDISVAGRELFHIDELILRPGERVALLGHNGVGKTTFIRRLVDALAGADDAVRYGPQTSLGYYDQELSEVEGRGTMLEYVRDRTDAGEHAIVQRLIYAGFPYAQHAKRVCEMSGGERARLLFVVLSLNAPNFLVLDEPTNHIDVDGKEQLEEQLLQSDAALLITSHDRMFIERLAERFLWITEGRLVEIHSLERFLDDTTMSVQTAKIASADLQDGPQDLLARIVELEDLLAADTARKPKFQKPERQTAWQAELQRLNALL